MIATAAIPALKEVGININKLDPKWGLALTVGIYALPKLLMTFFPSPETNPPPPSSATPKPRTMHYEGTIDDPPPKNSPITHAEHVEAQHEEFKELYSESLNPDGSDKYANRRGIKKPSVR